MTKNYSALHESMQTRTLANGLRICYLPKEGFSKTFAILAWKPAFLQAPRNFLLLLHCDVSDHIL